MRQSELSSLDCLAVQAMRKEPPRLIGFRLPHRTNADFMDGLTLRTGALVVIIVIGKNSFPCFQGSRPPPAQCTICRLHPCRFESFSSLGNFATFGQFLGSIGFWVPLVRHSASLGASTCVFAFCFLWGGRVTRVLLGVVCRVPVRFGWFLRCRHKRTGHKRCQELSSESRYAQLGFRVAVAAQCPDPL